MLIQIKQSEIVAAIKQYVTNQGVNLAGKRVNVSFTASRGTAGILADISIEEAESLPDLGPVEAAPVSVTVSDAANAAVAQETTGHTEGATEKADEPVAEAVAAPVGKSLFAPG